MSSSPVVLAVRVDPDPNDELFNRFRCSASNALRDSDSDIIRVETTRDTIRFSRRSTSLRYIFRTPSNCKAYMDAFDNLRQKYLSNDLPIPEAELPRGFNLRLNETDLMRTRPCLKTHGSVRKHPPAAVTTRRVGGKTVDRQDRRGARSRR